MQPFLFKYKKYGDITAAHAIEDPETSHNRDRE
jgi:hypothetical protein